MTTETTGPETYDDHLAEARRHAAAAETCSVFDRSAHLQAAQVHATIAQTLKAAELMPMMARMADWVADGCPGEPPAVSASPENASEEP